MKRRWEVINRLIAEMGYRDYLEVGYATGACFRQVEAAAQLAVDPNVSADGVVTAASDDFFASSGDEWGFQIDIRNCSLSGIRERTLKTRKIFRMVVAKRYGGNAVMVTSGRRR